MSALVHAGARLSSRVALVCSALIFFVLSIGVICVHRLFHRALHPTMQMTEDADSPSSARPATVVRPISCTPLPDLPGKSIATALVSFPPNALTPRHRHPGSVTAYVLKGVVRSQLAGGGVGVYSAGQTWFEPPGAVHVFAENASASEPAELLAIFVTDIDCGPLTIFD